jgi:hypothetical protein
VIPHQNPYLRVCHQVSRIHKWQPKGVSLDTHTAINTEWGCYGSSLLPRVKEDLELDAASGPQQGKVRSSNLRRQWYRSICVQMVSGADTICTRDCQDCGTADGS